MCSHTSAARTLGTLGHEANSFPSTTCLGVSLQARTPSPVTGCALPTRVRLSSTNAPSAGTPSRRIRDGWAACLTSMGCLSAPLLLHTCQFLGALSSVLWRLRFRSRDHDAQACVSLVPSGCGVAIRVAYSTAYYSYESLDSVLLFSLTLGQCDMCIYSKVTNSEIMTHIGIRLVV